MRSISIQRQCDGTPTQNDRCEARLELQIDNPYATDATFMPMAGQLAWVEAARAQGWRCQNGPGEQYLSKIRAQPGMEPTILLVPFVKAWVSCAGCSRAMSLVCARCLAEHCSCIGGPWFNAISSADAPRPERAP